MKFLTRYALFVTVLPLSIGAMEIELQFLTAAGKSKISTKSLTTIVSTINTAINQKYTQDYSLIGTVFNQTPTEETLHKEQNY